MVKMSPLAPPENSSQSFNHQPKNQRNLIERGPNSKFSYSMDDLYGMRHTESRAPNLGNRSVLASISRPDAVPSVHTPGAFSQNITTSTLDRFQRDRRQFHQNRSVAAPRHNRNASNDGQTNHRDSNGERQRQPARDKGHRINQTSSSIQIRLSIKQDVKLCEAENAWKPSFLQRNAPSNGESDATELYKQVRSILNKLTAQNFAIMSEQFQNLKIDTKEKLVEVIDLVFNKAVNEPNFSEGYANLSKYLSHCSKQIDSSSTERAYFKRTLINKCQFEFERHVANKNTTEAALAPLLEKLKLCEKNGNANGVSEIKAQITDEESILRRRLVSTVRFIGELYKLDMLTTNIMNKCISMLICEATTSRSSANSNQANEKLECLCKLLTTVGKKLERKPTSTGNNTSSDKEKAQYLDLSNYMNQLKCIADGKIRNFKPSTRIKFMIMDVIELRNNKWVPKITNAVLHQKQMATF